MALLPLKIPPGLVMSGTEYEAKGRWVNGNLVRWHNGIMQPVGKAAAATGVPAGVVGYVHAYRTTNNVLRIATIVGNDVYVGASPIASPDGWASWAADDLDNFGDYLLLAASGYLAYWTGSSPEVALENPADAQSMIPAVGCVTTPEGMAVALQAGNVRRVAWSDQENITNWEFANASSQAGFFDLATQGHVLAGRRGRNETLLFTTTDVWSMRYIGMPLVYSFAQLGNNCGVLGARTMGVVDTRAFWMGNGSFFAYDGFVKPLPCDVNDYVFGRMNVARTALVGRCVPVSQFNEIWWFYATTSDGANDSYVCYNYADGHWTVGSVGRSCGVDRGAVDAPLFGVTTGGMAYHETSTGSPLGTSWVESGPIELGEGDTTMMVRKIVPDEDTVGDTKIRFEYRFSPTGAVTTSSYYTLSSFTDARFTARQVKVRIEQVNHGWRVGVPRLDVVPASER